ncbi:putative GIY-YIG nuclease family protein [Bacillus phage vB_BspM_AgentSmith]|nr:putative GIY-YIG nuclease family protein [Bacillus phage vB_BspM_AgentSmith]
MEEEVQKPLPTKSQLESRPIVPVNLRDFKSKIGAYTIKHYPSGKVYHGSTNNIYSRYQRHGSHLRTQTHNNKAFMDLMNENPLAYIEFFPTDTREEAYDVEQKLIDQTDSELLLNASLDSRSTTKGLWMRDEYREKFREGMLGNTHGAANKGRVTSEETKELIRQTKLGTKLSVEARRKMSKARIGNQNAKGVKHSTEANLRKAEAMKGRVHNAEHVAKVTLHKVKNRVSIDGVIYDHIRLAAEAIGVAYNTVNKRCQSPDYPNYKLVPVELGVEV